RVARGAAGRGPRHRHLAAVGVPVAGHPGRPHDRGPRHRQDRVHPDRGAGSARAERCLRLPLRRRHRPQLLKRGAMSETDAEFARLARDYLDDRAERHPDAATGLGDHRFDARLPDPSAQARADERRALDGWAARLRARPRRPVRGAPGGRRDDGGRHRPAGVRDRRTARAHVESAGRQPGQGHLPAPGQGFRAAARPAGFGRREAGRDSGSAGPGQAGARADAPGTPGNRDRAVRRHDRAGQQPDRRRPRSSAAGRGPARPGPPGRIGGADRAPGLAVRAAADADAILARAEADLDRVSEQITELAARITGQISGAAGPGVVPQVLGRLAEDVPDDATILEFCRAALAAQTAFVTDRRLITVYDDPIELIPMPEIDRGVAVAYCDSPGPLEPVPQPTFIAVSPTPADWTAERVASFYREYNRHMVHDLMVHEA